MLYQQFFFNVAMYIRTYMCVLACVTFGFVQLMIVCMCNNSNKIMFSIKSSLIDFLNIMCIIL